MRTDPGKRTNSVMRTDLGVPYRQETAVPAGGGFSLAVPLYPPSLQTISTRANQRATADNSTRVTDP